MRQTPRALLTVLGGINVLTFQIHAEPLGLRVSVYNLAKVPEPILRRATHVTSEVFAAAGIALEWDEDRNPVSAFNRAITERGIADTDLFLWLLPKELSKRIARSPSTAGSALESGSGRRDTATIFYDRIAEAARMSQSSRSAVLGYLMSHEIGHLLLGENAHKPYGLMRHTWELSDFRAAERGELRFLDEQVSIIRAEVTRRTNARKSVPEKHEQQKW